MKNTTKALLAFLVVLILVVLVSSFAYSNNAKSITATEFFENAGVSFVDTSNKDSLEFKQKYGDAAYIGDGFVIYKGEEKSKIDKIIVDVYNLKGYKNNKLVFQSSYGRNDGIYDKVIIGLQTCDIKIGYTDPNSGSVWSNLIMPLCMMGIAIFLIVMFMRQMGSGNKNAFDFGRTKAQVITNTRVRFADVAGAEEEKLELQEIVDFLKSPQKYTALGAKIPRGVLLVGNPGTGKTLFAKAVAGEANVPFFSISGSDFVEMFVGVGASRVRDLFNTAKKNQPCIVFIDEIDAVGRQRGAGLGGGNDEREQTLNQLLVQMDGFESNEGIIVMAATNRADVLDPALLRPGRFDRQIYVNMPDVRGREAILKVHARNKPLAPDVNFKVLARMTSGFSGADLANLLNEAAILAARANKKYITNSDLYESIDKVMLGPQKKSRLVTETDKRITAYHESGHAIVAKLMPNCDPVHEVSIIPRGMAGGYTMTRPDNDDSYYTRSRLLDNIVMTMGGRAAEAIVCKEVTSGPSSDIVSATRTARRMVTQFGMSDKIGPVSYGDNEEVFLGRDYQTRAGYSDDTAKEIDEEVRRIVNDGYKKAVDTLTANRSLLDVMARVLIEKETIFTEEVEMIMSGKTAEEVIEYMDKKEDVDPLTRETKNEANDAQNESGENGQKE